MSLTDKLSGPKDPDSLLNAFLAHAAEIGVSLYPAQEEAILEIFSGKHVILNTPTGSGKSLVALAMHFKAMAEGKRSYYTAPVKALVSEKFFALCKDFGAENVGMLTGDASVNRDASIICCTQEILASMALSELRPDVAYAVIDEFHYYSDKDRGAAWQIPLLELTDATFLLMSATLGDVDFFSDDISRRTKREVAVVKSRERPVPLDFEFKESPLFEVIPELIGRGRYPIYLVNFAQREAVEQAQNLMSTNFLTKEQKQRIGEEIGAFRFDTPFGKELARYLKHGLGLHHAGLLPKYRLLTEKLAQKGLLAVVSGTDTLGVGVNVPIRTVLFTKLCKYDGEKTAILSVRDFHQISGRAGRKGFDDRGFVLALAPEHVIENKRIDAKLRDNPGKKLQKKKPPDFGYVPWDQKTFEKLIASEPEALQPQFEITHAMILAILESGGGYQRLLAVIARSHTPDRKKKELKRTAATYFRSLVAAGVLTVKERRIEVHDDLQGDFSITHALALWLLSALKALDREAQDYHLDVLTLCESIAENPRAVLERQLDALKRAKLDELKMQGVPYEERIQELEKMEWPKPRADFIYETFNAFRKTHPWLMGDNIRPKSIARDMYERYASFNDYVREYGLQRSEGVLLRYLSDVYRTLDQTVPQAARTEPFEEVLGFFGTLLRQVDTSLVDEWDRLRKGIAAVLPAGPKTPISTLPDARIIRLRVRSELHRLVQTLANKDYDDVQSAVFLDPDDAWPAERAEKAIAPYFTEHARIVTTPMSRAPQLTHFEEVTERHWRVSQTLVDPADQNDWHLRCDVFLDEPLPSDTPLVRLREIAG
jgi:superfamily II RNA helicase